MDQDLTAIYDSLKSIIRKNPGKPVIIFDLRDVASIGRYDRFVYGSMIERVNEMLSARDVCQDLGTVFTLAYYGDGFCFLIAADLAHSVTPKFDPATKSYRSKAK